jgi:hypothetical protein
VRRTRQPQPAGHLVWHPETAEVLYRGAYPQQERKIERLCGLVSSYPDTWIATIISRSRHLETLTAVATRRKQSLRVMLDLDAGMHRTGIEFGPDATELYRRIDADPAAEQEVFSGAQLRLDQNVVADPRNLTLCSLLREPNRRTRGFRGSGSWD